MRLPDWEERFSALVVHALGERFAWGKFDCCTFAADAVVAVTGQDPMAELRKSYSSLRSAWRLLHDLGGLESAVTKVLGSPMENAAYAQRADIVLVNGDGYPALGVVVGQSAMAPLSIGVQRIPAGDWLTAWRVD